jgi:hypothetical protein
MMCFECAREGKTRDAVGLCHHCSAALCSDHAQTVDDPVTAAYPIAKTITLPRHARLVLCETCKVALEQSHGTKSVFAA